MLSLTKQTRALFHTVKCGAFRCPKPYRQLGRFSQIWSHTYTYIYMYNNTDHFTPLALRMRGKNLYIQFSTAICTYLMVDYEIPFQEKAITVSSEFLCLHGNRHHHHKQSNSILFVILHAHARAWLCDRGWCPFWWITADV